MPSCIVCHLNIDNDSDSRISCDNDHLVHKYCLAEWLLHSDRCPLCSDPYPQNIIDQFKDFKEQKEREKQEALDKELEEEAKKKMSLSSMGQEAWNKGRTDLPSPSQKTIEKRKLKMMGKEVYYLNNREWKKSRR